MVEANRQLPEGEYTHFEKKKPITSKLFEHEVRTILPAVQTLFNIKHLRERMETGLCRLDIEPDDKEKTAKAEEALVAHTTDYDYISLRAKRDSVYTDVCFSVSVDYGKDQNLDYKQRTDEFRDMPNNFTYPAYAITISNYNALNSPITTRYGVISDYFVGADNKLYLGANHYIMDTTGQAVKVERISSCSSSPDEEVEDTIAQNVGEEYIEALARVNVIPEFSDGSDEMVDIVPLTPGDIEQLGVYFQLVKAGIFAEHIQIA